MAEWHDTAENIYYVTLNAVCVCVCVFDVRWVSGYQMSNISEEKKSLFSLQFVLEHYLLRNAGKLTFTKPHGTISHSMSIWMMNFAFAWNQILLD